MNFDWLNITEDKILNLLKEGYNLLKNDGGKYSDGPDDQYILVKI